MPHAAFTSRVYLPFLGNELKSHHCSSCLTLDPWALTFDHKLGYIAHALIATALWVEIV